MTDHLTPHVPSDRGFQHLPPINGTYPGNEVRVYESSAALGPHLWISVKQAEMDAGGVTKATVYLTAEAACQVAEQLLYALRHHYQGNALPVGRPVVPAVAASAPAEPARPGVPTMNLVEEAPMTDRLTFEVFGASDDLVEVQGDITEEYSVFVGGSALLRLARRDGAGVFIHGRYVAPGCWMLGVSPIDEGVPVPDGWSFELDRDPVVPHSMRLRVDVDPSAALTLVEGD